MSDRFVDVRQSTIERRLTMSAGDYVSHLSTISAYLELPVGVRARAFEAILAALPPQVDVVADLTLHLARLGLSPARATFDVDLRVVRR